MTEIERYANAERQAKIHVGRHHSADLKSLPTSGLSWVEMLALIRERGMCTHSPAHIYPAERANP